MLSQYPARAAAAPGNGKVGSMPFLDRLQRWADDRPDETAVVVAGEHLSWSGLRDKAAALVPAAPAVTVLSEQNSTRFAVAFAAAVAGERQCAVLDPAWPQQLQDGITARIARDGTGAGGTGAAAGGRTGDRAWLTGRRTPRS